MRKRVRSPSRGVSKTAATPGSAVMPESPINTKRRNPFGETSPVYVKQTRHEEVDMDLVYRTAPRLARDAKRPKQTEATEALTSAGGGGGASGRMGQNARGTAFTRRSW